MPPRLYIDDALPSDGSFDLPPAAVRHAQVLRLQPGAALTLFNGEGGEWQAEVLQMNRSTAQVRITGFAAVDRELPCTINLTVGMPTNERMDALVEKATELGVATIDPVLCERSVLRLSGERAERRCEHWRGIAVAAAEQCGRARVPQIGAVRPLVTTLMARPADAREQLLLLSLDEAARPLAQVLAPLLKEGRPLRVVSGPEGGLTAAEEAIALRAGAMPVSLGPRVLRADTAPLAVLAAAAALAPARP